MKAIFMNQDCKKNELMANTFFMLFFNGAIEWHVVTVSFPIHFSCSVNQTFKDSSYKSKLSFMSIWKKVNFNLLLYFTSFILSKVILCHS